MDTAGFVRHRVIYGSGTGSTRHGYGVCGYGYGVGKPDPRVTRSKPYLSKTMLLQTLILSSSEWIMKD